MNGTNGNQSGFSDKALVPYPVILAATQGDPDAMKMVPILSFWQRRRATRTL